MMTSPSTQEHSSLTSWATSRTHQREEMRQQLATTSRHHGAISHAACSVLKLNTTMSKLEKITIILMQDEAVGTTYVRMGAHSDVIRWVHVPRKRRAGSLNRLISQIIA